jgi:uncharacterized protein DUF4124
MDIGIYAAVAAVLFKSVSPDGVVSFSDQPPADRARPVQRIELPGAPPSALSPNANGNPIIISGVTPEEQMRGSDEAVQRASAQVDLAEHALAQARRPLWTEPDVHAIANAKMTRSDFDRLEFYKKNVRIARAQLMDVLREKRKADARTYTASNAVSGTEWTPVR